MSTTWTTAYWQSTSSNWIDKITIPSGTTYDLVDSEARSKIDGLGTYTNFLGVTTTNLEDGTTNPVVTIGDASVTATVGNIVIHTISTTAGRIAEEFIYADGKWQLFGDISADNLGNLAYKSTATAIYRPAGTISTTTGTLTSSGKLTPAGNITLTTASVVAKLSTTSTAPTGSNTANFWIYTPSGTISITSTPSTNLTTATVLTGVTGRTVVNSITSGAPAPNTPTGGLNYTTVASHNLQLQYIVQQTNNALSSTSTSVVVNGVTVNDTIDAAFEGTEIYLKHPSIVIPSEATFTGTASTVTVTGTVINGASFSGTTATIAAT